MSDRPPTRAAIYTRLARPSNDGIARQFHSCRQYAEACGYQVIDTYSDNGMSGAANAVRPALAELVANIGQYGVIVVTALDRIARSPRDLESIADVAEHYGTRIETVDSIDLHSDTGRLVSRMLTAIESKETGR